MDFLKKQLIILITLCLVIVSCDSSKVNPMEENLELDYQSTLLEDEEFRSAFSDYIEISMLGYKNFVSNTTFEEQEIIEGELQKIENNTPLTNLEIFVSLYEMNDEETLIERFGDMDNKWKNIYEKYPFIKDFDNDQWVSLIEELENYQVQLRDLVYIGSPCAFNVYSLGPYDDNNNDGGSDGLPSLDEWTAIYCPNWTVCSTLFQNSVNQIDAEFSICINGCIGLGLKVFGSITGATTAIGSTAGGIGAGPGFIAGSIPGSFFGTITSLICASDCYEQYEADCEILINGSIMNPNGGIINCCGQ